MNNDFAIFDRSLLKGRAKNIIKQNYWKCFLAALVLYIVTDGGNVVQLKRQTDAAESIYWDSAIFRYSIADFIFFAPLLVLIAIMLVILGTAVTMAVKDLIAAPLEVSGRRFFMEASQRRFDLGELGFGFSGNFFNVFKVILLRDVFICLWTLLLVVPGIMKMYSYRMVSYILAENPDMNYKRALKISEEMTKGYKMELFILDLSFMGWLILGALCFGIGIFFVLPYVEATNTEAYLFLRARALDIGIIRIGELSR